MTSLTRLVTGLLKLGLWGIPKAGLKVPGSQMAQDPLNKESTLNHNIKAPIYVRYIP